MYKLRCLLKFKEEIFMYVYTELNFWLLNLYSWAKNRHNMDDKIYNVYFYHNNTIIKYINIALIICYQNNTLIEMKGMKIMTVTVIQVCKESVWFPLRIVYSVFFLPYTYRSSHNILELEPRFTVKFDFQKEIFILFLFQKEIFILFFSSYSFYL